MNWHDITNSVRGLLSARHVTLRLRLLHYTNCCMPSWTTFPSSHFTNDMLSWNQSHTLYNTRSYLAQGPSIVCVYRSSSDSSLRSQFLVWVLSISSRGLVTSCFLIINLSWIIPLSCCFGLWLPLACNITCLGLSFCLAVLDYDCPLPVI